MRGISRRFISIIWVASLMVAMCLLYSCAKMTVIESEQIGVGTLSLSVTVAGDTVPFENKLENNAPIRTIAPDQITGTQLNADYTLRLTASNEIQGDIVQNITLTDGKATLSDIPFGSWEFKLEALDGNNTPVLEAVSGATIDYVKLVHVSFVLKPVKNGNGSVDVRFNLNATDVTQLGNDATVKVGLYDPVDYKLVAGSERTPTFAQNFTYNLQGIPTGEYILRLTITAGANGSLKQGAYITWSDRVYVEFARTSEASVTLTQLFKKPTAPTSLTFTNNGVTTGVANVTLTWGHVYTADSYELEVLEYEGTTAPTNDTTWTTAQNANSKLVEYNATPNDQNNYLAHDNKFASQYYIDGGLLPCQNTIGLGLRVSTKSYAARIRAINFYGDSDWVYFTAPTGNNAIPIIARPTAPTNFDFNAGAYDDTSQSFFTTFTWTDTSNNEDGFELELMVIKRTDTFTPATTDATWKTLADRTTSKRETYRGNSIGSSGGDPCAYEGGSLLAGSTSVSVSIKRHIDTEYYAVRIRAYNSGGNSDWAYPLTRVNSFGTATHQKILMPYPYITYSSTAASGGTFSATITVKDIPNSGCYYQYEFATSTDFTSLFNKSDPGAKNTAWTPMHNALGTTANYRAKANNEWRFTIYGIPTNIPLVIRVRVVTLNDSFNGARGATPWYYHHKRIIPNQQP